MTREEAIQKRDIIVTQLINELGVTIETNAKPLIRCGECKHLMPDGRCREFADDAIRPSASDFCSYGERKE